MHFMGVLAAFGAMLAVCASASASTTVDTPWIGPNAAQLRDGLAVRARTSRALLRTALAQRPTLKPTAAPMPKPTPRPTPKPTPKPTAAPAPAATANKAVLQALVGTTTAVTKAATVTPIGSATRVAGMLVTVATAAATTVTTAANFDRYGTALRMRGTSGQLAIAVTTAANTAGHVDSFVTQLTAGTSNSWFFRCSALPTTVTAYRDFTSCAAYASYVKSLGGTAKEAANCANNLRRVLLFKKKYSVPIAGTLDIADAALHDFTSLDIAVDSACSMHALAVNSMTAGVAPGQPEVTRRQMADQGLMAAAQDATASPPPPPPSPLLSPPSMATSSPPPFLTSSPPPSPPPQTPPATPAPVQSPPPRPVTSPPPPSPPPSPPPRPPPRPPPSPPPRPPPSPPPRPPPSPPPPRPPPSPPPRPPPSPPPVTAAPTVAPTAAAFPSPPPVQVLTPAQQAAAGYCTSNGVTLYTKAALSYQSAVAICAAAGKLPAKINDGVVANVLSAVASSSVNAAAAACGVPSQSYMYYAAAGSTTGAADYCPFAYVTKAGAAAAYTATYLVNKFACETGGFGALVVCA